MLATSAGRISRGERLNAGEKPGRLGSELATRGIRLTRQRRVILHVMDTAQRHLDAEVLFVGASGVRTPGAVRRGMSVA